MEMYLTDYGTNFVWYTCHSDQSLSLSDSASEFVTIMHLICLQLSKLHKQAEDNQKTTVTGSSSSLVQNIDFVNKSLSTTSQSTPHNPGIYSTGRKLLLEFNFRYFVNARFAKFKFRSLKDFDKLGNDS